MGRSPGGGGTAGECCRCCDSEEAPGLGCSSPGNGLGKGKAVHFWSHFLRRNKACETLARKKSCPFDFVVGFSTGRPWNSAIYDRLWPFSGRNPPNKRQRSVQRTHCNRRFLFGRIWRFARVSATPPSKSHPFGGTMGFSMLVLAATNAPAQTPGTATKKRRAQQEAQQEAQQLGAEAHADLYASFQEPSSEHTSVRAVRLRLQRAERHAATDAGSVCSLPAVSPSVPSLPVAHGLSEPAGHAPPATMGAPASLCFGFFSKRTTGERLPSLPRIGCGFRSCSPFLRAPGACVQGSPHKCACSVLSETRTVACAWCLSQTNLQQEHEEMLALYREAKAAGHVVDPSD